MAVTPAEAQRIRHGRTPQEVLGVDPKATPDEIKAAQRKLVRDLMPRMNAGDTEAGALLALVNRAATNLTKPPLPDTPSPHAQGAAAAVRPQANPDQAFDETLSRIPAENSFAGRQAILNEYLDLVTPSPRTMGQMFVDLERLARAMGPNNEADFAALVAGKLGRFFLPHFRGVDDFLRLTSLVSSPRLQSDLLKRAFASMGNPDQFINAIRNGLPSGASTEWRAAFRGALEENLPKFFAMNPNSKQTDNLEFFLKATFGDETGSSLFQTARSGAAPTLANNPLVNAFIGAYSRVRARLGTILDRRE